MAGCVPPQAQSAASAAAASGERHAAPLRGDVVSAMGAAAAAPPLDEARSALPSLIVDCENGRLVLGFAVAVPESGLSWREFNRTVRIHQLLITNSLLLRIRTPALAGART